MITSTKKPVSRGEHEMTGGSQSRENLVWGVGCLVWGLGFGVWGLGFGVEGLRFGIWGVG